MPKNNLERVEIFEKMPVRRAVISQIIPAVASQMITLIYNIADTYFVGLLNDPVQTACMTVSASSFVMLTAVSNLFGVGGASSIARELGMKNNDSARKTSAISIYFGLLAGVLFSLIFASIAKSVLPLCGATAETYPFVYKYTWWTIIIGGPFTVLSTLLGNIVRADGDAKNASIGLAVGGILNIILDPLFVLPSFLGLGAEGAGIATAISNTVSCIYFIALILIRRERTVISLDIRHLRSTSRHISEILKSGFPSALQFSLTVVAAAAQSKFMSKYSTEAVAAFGIVKKLDQLPLFFSIGVANGMLPFLAYNYSSGNHKRRGDAFKLGATVSVGFSLACLAVYEIFAPCLASLFIKDALTVDYSSKFLRCMVTAMPFVAFNYPMIIQFQAMGRVKESLVCSLVRKGMLDIPLLFLLDSIFPLYGCVWVQPIVDCFSFFVASWFYLRMQKKIAQK